MIIRVVQLACPLSLPFSWLTKSAFFIMECANNTEVICHCTDKQPCTVYWDLADLYNVFSFRGEQLYNSISLVSSIETFVLACICTYVGTEWDTWRINCMFLALPTTVPQGMPLGSIAVDPHRQNLNIVLPPFCSNVFRNEREKEANGGKFSYFI